MTETTTPRCETCGTPSIKSRRSCPGCGMRPGRLHNNGLCAGCQHPAEEAPAAAPAAQYLGKLPRTHDHIGAVPDFSDKACGASAGRFAIGDCTRAAGHPADFHQGAHGYAWTVEAAPVNRTRETSNYTLRLPDRDSAARVAAHLTQVSDHGGGTTVSYRAAGDAEAIRVATDALTATGETRAAELTTGLGAHKRTVAVQDEAPAEETCKCAAEVLGNSWHTPGCPLAVVA